MRNHYFHTALIVLFLALFAADRTIPCTISCDVHNTSCSDRETAGANLQDHASDDPGKDSHDENGSEHHECSALHCCCGCQLPASMIAISSQPAAEIIPAYPPERTSDPPAAEPASIDHIPLI